MEVQLVGEVHALVVVRRETLDVALAVVDLPRGRRHPGDGSRRTWAGPRSLVTRTTLRFGP
jgi:hypothetical protein